MAKEKKDNKNNKINKNKTKEILSSRKITETKGGTQKVKRPRIVTILTRVIIGLAVASAAIMIIYIESNTFQKRKKLEQINQQISRLEIENQELEMTLKNGKTDGENTSGENDENLEEYMKKIAMEKYGYAYPDEIRFYDKSHN